MKRMNQKILFLCMLFCSSTHVLCQRTWESLIPSGHQPVDTSTSDLTKGSVAGTINFKPIWNIAYNFRKLMKTLTLPIRIGVKITSTSGHVFFEQYPNQRFIPYSNTKLITAGAALYYLGADYRFSTQFLTDGVLKDGVVEGNMYLKATGDPSITGSDVIGFISQLAQLGITKITGDFRCDYFDYDEKPYVEGAALNDVAEYWCSPVFALIDDRNYVDRSVPGRERFQFMFTCDPLTQLVKKIEISSLVDVFSMYVREICSWYGITVQGEFGLGHVPDGAIVVIDHTSAPLPVLIADMLEHSYNIDADSLFKRIGAHCFGVPGTWEKGAKAIDDFLENKVGISSGEFHLEDGSGVSRNNSISTSSMVKFLSWMSRSPLSEIFMECLPVSGEEKCIRGRVAGKPTRSMTRGGEVSTISALSGFVYNKHEPTMIFSIMFDGIVPPRTSIIELTTQEEELTADIIACLTK